MERQRGTWVSAVAFILAVSATNAYSQTPLYVGVLENINDAWHPGDRKERVRVAFVKEGDKWLAMGHSPSSPAELASAASSFPETVKWFVVFDGRELGQIASKDLSPYQSYGDFGLQEITSPESAIPKIAADAGDFTYISGVNHARTRPLLVVSTDNYKDPEKWKRTNLTDQEHKIAIDEFRKKVPQLEHCTEPDAEKPDMLPYSDNEIILIKAYRAKNGELLFGERLDDSRSGCGFFDDDNFYDYWFARTKDGDIHFLGTNMMPIDAADLDNDGSSAWVFHTSHGEDDDGYELFYDDFSKMTTFDWFYH